MVDNIKMIESIQDPNVFFQKLIWSVLNKWVSDIHITPLKTNVIIRYRLAWELLNFCMIPTEAYKRLLNVIKNNSNMDTNDNQHSQDWKIFMEFDLKEKKIWVNLRISTLPTIYGENVVIRLLVKDDKMVNLEKLWYSKKNLDVLYEIDKLRSWLVLVAWGTWSWKTTTLYSLLRRFDPFKKTIYTLEDPVEYQVEWYVQSEIKSDNDWKHFSFTDWLKWLLRQDPDIILVWEVRSIETASMCLEAANTWHLVFGSIHANDALSVINRLKQLWIKSYLLSSGLKYIVYQKLVRRLCECHKTEDIIATDLWLILREKMWLDKVDAAVVNPQWCPKCLNGYVGVTPVTEIITIDDTLAQMIFDEKSIVDIRNYLVQKGFYSVHEDAIYKSLDWQVDFNEAMMLKY